MKYLLFVLLLGGLLACGLPSVTFTTPTPMVTPSPTVTPTVTPVPVDAEAEYYRGAYDLCVKALESREQCIVLVHVLKESDWYSMPSRGWVWPMATPTPGPAGSTF